MKSINKFQNKCNKIITEFHIIFHTHNSTQIVSAFICQHLIAIKVDVTGLGGHPTNMPHI